MIFEFILVSYGFEKNVFIRMLKCAIKKIQVKMFYTINFF